MSSLTNKGLVNERSSISDRNRKLHRDLVGVFSVNIIINQATIKGSVRRDLEKSGEVSDIIKVQATNLWEIKHEYLYCRWSWKWCLLLKLPNTSPYNPIICELFLLLYPESGHCYFVVPLSVMSICCLFSCTWIVSCLGQGLSFYYMGVQGLIELGFYPWLRPLHTINSVQIFSSKRAVWVFFLSCYRYLRIQ